MGISGHDPQAAPLPDTPTLARPLPPPPSRLPCPALFLDLDGVLAPLAPTPEAVVPDTRRTAVLRALIERLDGRVAIISGRTLAEVDRISEDAVRSASGVHGLERRSDDGTLVVGDAAPEGRAAVAAFMTSPRIVPA